jgi:hypothetical protein
MFNMKKNNHKSENHGLLIKINEQLAILFPSFNNNRMPPADVLSDGEMQGTGKKPMAVRILTPKPICSYANNLHKRQLPHRQGGGYKGWLE